MKSALVGVVVVTVCGLATPVLGQFQFPDITQSQFVRVTGSWTILGVASSDGVHPDLGVNKDEVFEMHGRNLAFVGDGDSGSYVGPGGSNNDGSARISALAAIGSLHAVASVLCGGSDDNIILDAHAGAATIDHIMLIVPGILPFGARVRVEVPFKFKGNAAAAKSVSVPIVSNWAKAYATYRAGAIARELNGEFLGAASSTGRAVALEDFTLDEEVPPSQFLMTIDVRPNQFFEVGFQMDADAHFEFNDQSIFGIVSGSGGASASFQNTLAWGGISSVTDPITGQPIQGWSVVSQSGADYSKSFETPEPTSLLLASFWFAWPRRPRRDR